METAAQQREVRIETLVDHLAEIEGGEGTDWYVRYDDRRARAESELDAIEKGLVQPQTYLVLPQPDGIGWTYTAVEPDAGLEGCQHTVDGADRGLAKAAAVAEHRRVCQDRAGWTQGYGVDEVVQ